MKPAGAYIDKRHFLFLSSIFLGFVVLAIVSRLWWLAAIPFFILFVFVGWQWKEIFFYVLIVSLPWSFEYNFSSSLGTDLPDEPLMLLVSASFLAWLCYQRPSTTLWRKHPLLLLLLLYYAWILFTVPFSSNWVYSIKFFLAKTWYITSFVLTPLVMFTRNSEIERTGRLFLISMLSVTIVIVTRHATLGFRFADVNRAVAPFFRNHVNYSSMLVCSIPLLVTAFQLTKYRIIVSACIVFVAVAVFLSYSRGAWVALIVGLISYWLIRKGKLLISFIVAVLLLAGFLYWISSNDRYLAYANNFKKSIFHKDFRQHLAATYRLQDLSTAERFNRWTSGARMIPDHWLMGYGPNTFYDNYKPYMVRVFKTWVSDNKEHSTVHNYFLLLAIEQGVPGLFFFLLLIVGMIAYSQRLYLRIRDRFYKSVAMACGVITMMLITVNFLSDLVETDKVGSLFFLCLATLVSVDVTARRELHTLPKN